MKKPFNPVIPDYTPRGQKKAEVSESWLKPFKPCCICNGAISQGYYGRHGDGGTCSKKCELTKESNRELPLLPGSDHPDAHDVVPCEGTDP